MPHQRLLKAERLHWALLALPAITALAVVSAQLAPVFAVLLCIQVVRPAVGYGLANPGRSLLFSVLGREEKYQSKSLVDTALHRVFDWVAIVLLDRAQRWFGGADAVLLDVLLPVGAVFGALCIAWLLLALALARRHGDLARR